MQRILVIEDDVTTRRALKILLEMQKYCVLEAVDGVDGLNMFDNTCSLIIVDIMMPRMSGIEVCKKIREISNVPILFLTARSSDNDIATGLQVGGDDYLVKPFSNKELIARINALIRRHLIYNIEKKASKDQDEVIQEAGVMVYTGRNHVEVDGIHVRLTEKEYQIIKLLISSPNKVFSGQEIYEAIWDEMFIKNSENTIMVHIKNLRMKLSKAGGNVYIKTVWGRGYKFEG